MSSDTIYEDIAKKKFKISQLLLLYFYLTTLLQKCISIINSSSQLFLPVK